MGWQSQPLLKVHRKSSTLNRLTCIARLTMSSGLKKFMHKVGDKLDISKGHHNDNNGGATKVRPLRNI